VTKLLVDGDIFAFRCAAAAENEDEGIAKYYVDKLLDDCLAACSADSFQLFLTGTTNFRYQVYPEYKANRLEQERPRHLAYLRNYLISIGAVVSDGCEADDLLGIAQTRDYREDGTLGPAREITGEYDTVICSLDKDLLMIPGPHYSWEISGVSKGTRWTKPAKYQEVDHVSALRWFYTQMLTGDAADNIKGAVGVGKVGAAKILAGLETNEEMFEAIRPHFSCDEEILMTGQCLWIWRKENDIWELPIDTSVS
jgi:DNA polymerase-1